MTSPTITVASYNMRKAVGTDRRRRPDRVLHVLQEMDADIVALQEADKRFGTRASAVPHGLIDGHGLYKPVEFGVSHSRLAHAMPWGERVETMLELDTRNLGWHGNAMLVKRDIEVTGVEALHLPTLEPRGAVLAELGRPRAASCGSSACTSTSAGCGGGGRCAASSSTSSKRHRPMPTVLMGDTNEWRAAGGCLGRIRRRLSLRADRQQLSRAPPGRRARPNPRRPTRCGSRRRGSMPAPRRKKASDHLPVWARLGALAAGHLALAAALDRGADARSPRDIWRRCGGRGRSPAP